MAVRFRKYFNECKPMQCTGRRSRQCPETPRRANGEYKTCGVWCIEFFDDQKRWQSLTFKDIRNKSDAEKRLTLFIADRERGQLKLPKKMVVPTLAAYSETYLELSKMEKENTFAQKRRAVGALAAHLGEYPLDKITGFLVERYRVARIESGLGDSTVNTDVAVLTQVRQVEIVSLAISGGCNFCPSFFGTTSLSFNG